MYENRNQISDDVIDRVTSGSGKNDVIILRANSASCLVFVHSVYNPNPNKNNIAD